MALTHVLKDKKTDAETPHPGEYIYMAKSDSIKPLFFGSLNGLGGSRFSGSYRNAEQEYERGTTPFLMQTASYSFIALPLLQ